MTIASTQPDNGTKEENKILDRKVYTTVIDTLVLLLDKNIADVLSKG